MKILLILHNWLNKAMTRYDILAIFLGILIALFLTGCSKQYIPMKYECKPAPIMLPITILNGTISGKSLDNLIHNHINLWEYIHYLEVKGCK